MKNVLRKLKLIDYLTTELPISQGEFVQKLKAVTDQGGTGFFSGTFDAFSSSKNEFKGWVEYDRFKIKRRRRFFDTNMNLAVANGTFSQQNEILKIATEINGFNGVFIPYYVFLLIFYSIFIGMANFNNTSIFISLFITVHASIMFGMPYFMMRRSIKNLKYELEREFYYLTKK